MKSVTLGEKDKDLIAKIQAYQKEKALPTFVDAVRSLCNSALQINKGIQGLK